MHQPSTHIPITFPTSTHLHHDEIKQGAKYLRWSHAQLHYAAELFARNLSARGVKRGMPMAVLLGNGVEWMVACLSAVRLGCAFVPLNPKCVGNAKEAAHMLGLSGARVVIAGDAEVAGKFEGAVGEEVMGPMVLRIVVGGGWDGWVEFGDLFDEEVERLVDVELEMEGEDVAMMPFTSGTTSLPKAAIHTSTSLSASILSLASVIPFTASSKNGCHMPLFHIGGIIFGVGFMAAGGATIIPSASFSASASLRAVEEEGCTDLPSVPSIVSLMAAEEKVGEVDLSSLKVVELGATTILEEHRALVGKALRCGVCTNGYAATEGVPISLGRFSTRSGEEGGKIHTGKVCPGARVRICDVESGEVVQRGIAGEIHFGGEMCIKGYVGGTSAESFYEDEVEGRWFKSGDQGVMREDGTLEVVGRYKDLIVRGGENIAPAAIEAVMDVKLGISAQVVGVKSEEAGEVPVAVLTKMDPNVSLADIRKTLIAELGTAFVPENMYSLEDLGLKDYPRTSSGKVRKIDLKDIVPKDEDSINTQPSSTPNDGAVASPIPTFPRITETKLIALWRKLLGVQVSRDSSIHDFADSLTTMRFRHRIKQDFGLDMTSENLFSADTIAAQAALLSSLSTSPSSPSPTWQQPTRSGPPTVDDISLTLGSPSVYDQIRQSVSTALFPLGFTWQDDVESILPSWDLGYEVFGSVAGTAQVNHRMAVTTKFADTDQLYSALCKAVEMHAMQRSFELVGPSGEPTMRVVVSANEKWFRYFSHGMEVLEVDDPEELVRLLNDGTHFAEVDSPFPSFLVRLARVKSTGTAGLIWALQHSAFDGLSLSTFLDDLDALLQPGHLPSSSLPPHIPYKPWADMYYLHRTSLAATRSVQRQVARLSTLPILRSSLFPPTPPTTSTPATHRRTYIAPKFSTSLPHLSSLRREHGIPPFILVKAALSIFLARKSGTSTAVFSQNQNGRSWPFVEEWQQPLLPNCMDLAGPTLERTVQIIPVPFFSSSSPSSSSSITTVLDFLLGLKRKQDEEAPDIHAPWNLVRQALRGGEEARRLFDTAAMSTCLNFLPVRTLNGEMVFENL
ncbi:AMP-binding enzyme family protein [Zymoseptoria brevis]|uniref:AMP-binding enzyme family protein n=1 Tax=Zymoseptoria brevis TaxID=1047168 RepID=A0A0F4GY46_9PEZI|nr:AMP-binding enzyme family protein [Zymoseptoria brevis]